MQTILWDIVSWVGGLIVICLFCLVCYFIGQLGVLMRTGVSILRQINKAERDGKTEGLSLTDEGIAIRQNAKLKLILPIFGIVVFYSLAFIFIPTLGMKSATLILLIPIVLGFFGIFFVPDP